MLYRLIAVLGIVHSISGQNPSPCPSVFSYEPRTQEQDRWDGVISLQTKEDLDGIWLKIIMDRPVELLGNYFGEVSSDDNQEFQVKNTRYKLEAGPPVSVRFFVKYNAATTIPSLKAIKLNGRTICTTRREELATTSLPVYTSNPKRISSQGSGANRPISNTVISSDLGGSSYERGTSNNYNQPSSNEDYFSSAERPSSTIGLSNTNSHRETYSNGGSSSSGGSTSSRRPSETSHSSNNNNRRQDLDYGTTSRRPVETSYSGSSSGTNSNSRRPTNSEEDYSSSTNNRRPSGTSSQLSNSGNRRQTTDDYSTSNTRRPATSSTNNQRESGNSGTHSNGLSIGEKPTTSGIDYFPGDWALNNLPLTRPSPTPITLTKRNVACGTVAMKASPLISFGQNTTQGQWPWHAALYYAQGAQLMYTCGGTLISEYHVLTAAHCVARAQSNRAIDTNKLAVYFGKHSLKRFGSGTQDREVSHIYIHPQYNYSVYFNDIAVLKLKDPVQITNYVRPCCLWEDSSGIEKVLNKYGTVVGWGFDEKRQISDTLMQAEMPVVSKEVCIYSNRDFFSQFTFEKNYCAGFRNGTTVCNGDSGGGMVFPKSGNSGHNIVWQIRGIVSVGVALQGQAVCDPEHYIVFTDVAKYLEWIKRVMDQ